MKYGYGYKLRIGERARQWYPVAFDKRSEAHKECREELSWISNQLYTQGHVTFFGFNFKVPFTRRAVEWSEINASKGLMVEQGINVMVGQIHKPIECPECSKHLINANVPYRDMMNTNQDGTDGQDRDNYSDDQDRDNYTVQPEKDLTIRIVNCDKELYTALVNVLHMAEQPLKDAMTIGDNPDANECRKVSQFINGGRIPDGVKTKVFDVADLKERLQKNIMAKLAVSLGPWASECGVCQTIIDTIDDEQKRHIGSDGTLFYVKRLDENKFEAWRPMVDSNNPWFEFNCSFEEDALKLVYTRIMAESL